jgi:hypothetical protein
MRDYVLFQICEPFRQQLISNHKFYVEQAQKRLLSQFDDIKGEANRFAEKWLEEHSHLYNPDRHDPGEFEERAFDKSITFYELLNDMRNTTRLSVVAGMFHEWDKQLRDWLSDELMHAFPGPAAKSAVWKRNFGDIIDLLECLGWPVRDQEYYAWLDACRLVVNIYKHGLGGSFEELKKNHPQFLEGVFDGELNQDEREQYLDHTHLKVSDEHMVHFSNAIIAFWADVPENTFQSQLLSIPN